jgi:phosphoribosylformylglycinamidine synthase subunit PurS
VPSYRCEVYIRPRADILDPQGDAVSRALQSLGFEGVTEVKVGRYILLRTEATSEAEARGAAESMCQKLLANPVTEDYDLQIGPES